jgi:hypothetical protein
MRVSGESWSRSQVVRKPLLNAPNNRTTMLKYFIIIIIIIIFSQVFPGTFPLEPMVIPTTQASNF